MKSRRRNLREVYVWQLPVRFFHWINALCIVVLCVTGYIIGDPPAIQHATEAIDNYWFGWVRFAHLATGMIFVVNILVRLYWAFAGNTFARWQNFVPLKKSQWKSIMETLKVDILLLTKTPVYDIGHNSLAATTYLGLFLLSVIQALTGFMMMFVTTNNVGEPATTWMLFGLNGFFVVRYIHHFLMWAFVIFMIIHVYLVFYHDYIERSGIASSMIGGWKFVRTDVYRDFLEERERECLAKNPDMTRAECREEVEHE
ncbi:MAG: Ni/Fe-hydrogenase, b-type cytochrome subunit [Clostridium sp.]|nr:Ni/Fe-hydrogenase, b-type cytochrome subunit [Clostridium sp.]